MRATEVPLHYLCINIQRFQKDLVQELEIEGTVRATDVPLH